MKLGADVPGGVGGGLEDCGRTAMTGINSFLRHTLSLRIS